MRSKLFVFLSATLIFTGLGSVPAHASTIPCSSGGSFTVVDNVVGSGITCSGTAEIPAGVTAIEAEAFRDATGLISVTMPSSLRSIGDYAFYLATSLTNASIPSTVTYIGPAAFYGAMELTSIVIPSGVTSIEPLTFYGAEKLSSVTFAAGSLLTEIKDQAFEKTYLLESITIPAGVTSIRDRAFGEARSLSTVSFVSDKTLVSIGFATFYGAPISSVVVPSSVTTIGGYAFEGTSLSSIYFLSDSAPEMDPTESPFYDIDGTPKAYIRSGATGFDPIEFARAPEETVPGLRGHGLEVEVGIYSVLYNNQNATTAQLGGSNYYLKGSAISSIPTTPPVKSGNTFMGWFTATSGGAKVTDNSYTPASPFGDVTLFAIWSEIPTPSTTIDLAEQAAAQTAAQAAAAELASRTIGFKKKYAIKPLAKQVGVPIVSPKAKVTFKVAKSSKKVCTKSGSKLKTLKAGNCVVTFTVQEPKPKKGKKPKATKTVKIVIVQ